jgi:hypothetical protein
LNHASFRPRCREFAPAGDLLFAPPKSRQKALPRDRSPSRCEGSPSNASAQAPRPTHFATLRSDKRRGVSSRGSLRSRAWALTFAGSAQGGGPEQPNSQQPSPTAQPSRLFCMPPLAPPKNKRPQARMRSTHQPLTSRRLFERSVAKRVGREGLRPLVFREPLAKRGAVRSGGALCLLSGGPESKSPAGAKSPHDPPSAPPPHHR